MKIKHLLKKAGMTISKNSPLILTVSGVLGLGVTGYLSYKAAQKVEVIVDDIEELQDTYLEDEGEPIKIDRIEVVKQVAGAIALPVATGLLSVTCITLSYYIMNNRIAGLATALTTATAEHLYYKKRVADSYGEDIANSFSIPVQSEKTTYKDEKGKETEGVIDVKADIPRSLTGQWFDSSHEYTADDHSYNLAYINSQIQYLQNRLFANGYLLLNELYEAFGFDRTRTGGVMGWSVEDSLNIDTKVVHMPDELGFLRPEIYINWSTPRTVYDDIELTGRYSPFSA